MYILFCAQGSGTLKISHFVSVIFIYSRTKIEVHLLHRYSSYAGLRAGFCDESHFAVVCNSRKPKPCLLALKVWGKLRFKVGSELSDCSISEFVFPYTWVERFPKRKMHFFLEKCKSVPCILWFEIKKHTWL